MRVRPPIARSSHRYLDRGWGVAIAAGPTLGGLLLTALGWRSIFLVNIPICALGLGLTLRCVPPAQSAKRKHRTFDLVGQFLAIVALTALIGTVVEALFYRIVLCR